MKPAIPTKSTPYTLPEGYLESSKKAILDTLKNSTYESASANLDMLAPAEPATVPEGYFASMQAKVLENMHAPVEQSAELIDNKSLKAPSKYFEEPPAVPNQRKPIKLYSPWRIATNVAATFLLLIAVGILYIKPSSQAKSQMYDLQTVSSSDWKDFLEKEGDMDYESNDPIVNLEYISDKEVKKFLEEEEEYLDI